MNRSKKHRVQAGYNEEQFLFLKSEAKRLGVSLSALLSIIVNKAIEHRKEKTARKP